MIAELLRQLERLHSPKCSILKGSNGISCVSPVKYEAIVTCPYGHKRMRLYCGSCFTDLVTGSLYCGLCEDSPHPRSYVWMLTARRLE